MDVMDIFEGKKGLPCEARKGEEGPHAHAPGGTVFEWAVGEEVRAVGGSLMELFT